MRITIQLTATSSAPTNIAIPAGITTSFAATIVEAIEGGDLPQKLFVITDANYTSPAESFQVPQGRSYIFRAPAGTNWSAGTVIGTIQLVSAGDSWTPPQPAVTATFEVFIDY